MKKLKKLLAIVFLSVMFSITGVFLASCGNDQKEITVTPSEQEIELKVGEEKTVSFQVNEFTFDGSIVVSASDVGVTQNEAPSGHVLIEQNYLGNGKTEVYVTGLSGGTSTLVAVSYEGNKTSQIIVRVNEYSSDLKAKDEILVLTTEEDFIPSEDNFIFSDQTTIKNLAYYYVLDPSKIKNQDIRTSSYADEKYTFTYEDESVLTTKEFVKAELDGDKIIFTQTEENKAFEITNVKDTQECYFIAEYANVISGEYYYAVSKFIVFYGIDANKFVFKTLEDDVKADSTIITYASENLSIDRFKVEVPYYINDLATSMLDFDYSLSDEDRAKLSVNLVETDDSKINEGKVTYTFEILSKVAYKTTANINFNVHYKDYQNAKSSLVSLTRVLPVTIMVAPKEIRVNGLKANEQSTYVFYNGNVGDYGWQDFEIAVYAEDSSYSGAKVEVLNSTNQSMSVLELKSGKEYISSGTDIRNLSIPLRARASTSTTFNGKIRITLLSEVFGETTGINKITYEIPFEIRNGATKLEFTDSAYDYSATKKDNGVYVSSSQEEVLFEGIYADNDFNFEKASIEYQGEERFAEVSCFEKREENSKYYLTLKIKPLRVGMQYVKVVLDNGRSIFVMVRVIDTFDRVNVSQKTINAENDGTISVTRSKTGDDDSAVDIIIQNSSSSYNQYSRKCTLKIDTNNGIDVINVISSSVSETDIIKVEQKTKGTILITTKNYGEESFILNVNGIVVTEDFKFSSVSKEVVVKVISYNPVSMLQVYQDDQKELLASKLNLYYSTNQNHNSVQKLYVDAKGNDVYHFFNPVGNMYVADLFKDDYIYWTSDKTIYDTSIGNPIQNQTMVYGARYKIGEYAIFNTTTMTITALSDVKQFSIFANVKQHDVVRTFEVKVTIGKYVEAQRVETNLNSEEPIALTPENNEKSFLVNVYDVETATNLEISVLVYEDNLLTTRPTLIETPQIEEINKGAYLVTITLKPSVLNGQGNVDDAQIVVVAKDWLSSDNSVYSEYERERKIYTVEYQDGSYSNPYSISNAEQFIAIGSSQRTMGAHYKLTSTIDLSTYSDSLPLGKARGLSGNGKIFTGSIRSENNSKIAGINVVNGDSGKYGLFEEIGQAKDEDGKNVPSFENITFEGSINLTSMMLDSNIGLIAGINNGTIRNISVILNKSKVEIEGLSGTINIGGIFGINNGEIRKDYDGNSLALFVSSDEIETTIISTSTQDELIYIGGIAGQNSGTIEDGGEKSTYAYNGYVAYTLISIKNSSNASVYAGSVSGTNSGNIFGALVGGKITTNKETDYLGGISGQVTTGGLIGVTSTNNGEAKPVTTRTALRGYNVGAITASFTGGYVKNVVIEATDDGRETFEEASMIVRYLKPIIDGGDADDQVNTGLGGDSENKIYHYISFGYVPDDNGDSFANLGITYKTYVSRTIQTSLSSSTDDYAGDYISICNNVVKSFKQFNKQELSGFMDIYANSDKGFFGFTAANETSAQAFNMYYFETDGYIQAGKFTTNDIASIQKILDEKFNKVSLGSDLCPFLITTAEYFMISSLSDLIKIDPQGNMVVTGTGIAKVVIRNMLDARLEKVVYLYITNYFNTYDILKDDKTMFTSDGARLSQGTTYISLYSDAITTINIDPNLKGSKIAQQGSQSKVDLIAGLNVNENGFVIVNDRDVRLVKNVGNLDVVVEKISGDFDNHASYVKSNTGIIFSKNPNVVLTNGTTDRLNLQANYSFVIDNQEFSFDFFATKPIVILQYFEGTKKINTNYENYILSTSSKLSDIVTIESDDENENLYYEIYKNREFVQNKESDEKLFDVSITPNSNGKTNSIVISVKKDSSPFENRFVNNIFGEYTIKYFGKTNQRKVYKELKLMLSDQYLENVVIDNYPKEDELYTSDKIVPAQKGLLSVHISPYDVDFTTFELKNNDINYTTDSTNANFEIGYLAGGKFEAIQGATYSTKGISISKTAIVNTLGENYDGQFYVRYLFGNSREVLDGARVSLTAILRNGSTELYSEELNYKVYKKFVFELSIEGKTAQESEYPLYYVARGVEYNLNIDNSGYDSNSISLKSSNSSVALVKSENGAYTLQISESALNYGEEGIQVTITANATRTNASGNIEQVESNITCQIMEYVINYSPTSTDLMYDIVTGYERGNLAVAVGVMNELSIDFGKGKYLEYNPSLPTVVEKVRQLLENASNNGTWNVYTDIGKNATLPERFGRGQSRSGFTEDVLTTTSTIENKFFSFEGLRYYTNSEHYPDQAKHYIFIYDASFNADETNGVYVIGPADANAINYLYSEFTFISYIRGSEENPNPITTYENLKSMNADAHYILTSDIYITPETFEPISANFATLDGNGFSIIFDSGDYDVTGLTDVGLFSEIGTNSIVKNLKVVYNTTPSKKLRFSTTDDQAVSVGLVASKNRGSIYNARVTTYGGVIEVNYNSASKPSVGSYVGGIAATNNGNITNCQVLASITTKVSLAGVVCTNTGTIASSYYKNGILTNTSDENTKFFTAGVVINNAENGKILTSYSSGSVDNQHIYSYNTNESNINSSVIAAGFVYSNLGEIRDCYSNIPIKTTSSCSGFVYQNAGKIENSFTTSIIINTKNQSSFYFVSTASVAGVTGTFNNCYYLKDSDNEVEYIDAEGRKKKINQSLTPISVEGVKKLNCAGFADLNNFVNYSYGASPMEYNNVWMFVANNQTVSVEAFRKTELALNNETGALLSSSYYNQDFAGGRLELVSANILASSFREFDKTNTKVENGVTTYFYIDGLVNRVGSILNPHVISTAEQFEQKMTSNGYSTENTGYFRLISTINYQDYAENISTYKVNFHGIIEGNGMLMRNVNIIGSETIESAGLLGKVNGVNNNVSAVMNLTIIPRLVNFPNAHLVGTIAGRIENANILNVTILSGVNGTEPEEVASVTVCGKSIVGGVVGLAKENCKIQGIVSRVGVKATNVANEEIYDPAKQEFDKYSYAGGILGYGFGKAYREIVVRDVVIAGNDTYYIASKTGLVFGGMSKQTIVEDVEITIGGQMLVSSHKYGGLVGGEGAGDVNNVIINGSSSNTSIFSVSGYIPEAVGGVLGCMYSGKISNVHMDQDITIKISANETINYVGGIVGYVCEIGSNSSVELENIVMSANLSARNILGGIVGYADAKIEMSKVAMRNDSASDLKLSFSVEGELANSYIGGFVGRTNKNVKISDAYSHADLNLKAYVYGAEIKGNIGSIIASLEEGANATLERIYTTTTYNVDLQDKRVVGSVSSVEYDASSQKFVIKNTSRDELTYNLQGVTDSATVYHWIQSSGDYSHILPTSTRFVAKKGSSSITLNQREFGKSVAQYYGTQTGSTNSTPSERMFYGLMTNDPYNNTSSNLEGWTNPKDNRNQFNAFPYLSFEDEIA